MLSLCFRDPPLLGGSVQYEEIASIHPAQPQHSILSQWLRDNSMVERNWSTPTAAATRSVERQQPQGSSSETNQRET